MELAKPKTLAPPGDTVGRRQEWRRLHFERRGIVQRFLIATHAHEASRQKIAQSDQQDQDHSRNPQALMCLFVGIGRGCGLAIVRNSRMKLRILMRIDEGLEFIDSQHAFRDVCDISPVGRRIRIELL